MENEMKNPVPELLAAGDKAEQAITALADCFEVTYTIRWLSSSKAVSKKAKDALVQSADAQDRGLSASKGLFRSAHPLVADLNEAKRHLEQYRDAFTLTVFAGLKKEEGDSKSSVVPGLRLIRREDVEEFDTGFRVRAARIAECAAKLQEYMRKPYERGDKTWPSVLDTEKEMLGSEYCESDYPADLSKSIQVSLPMYSEQKQVPVSLPKAIQERMHETFRKQVRDTLEGTVAAMADEFRDAAAMILDRTTQRVYANPVSAGLAGCVGKELRNVLKQSGMVTFDVVDGKKLLPQGPMPLAEYTEAWRPYAKAGDKKKPLHASVLDSLIDRLQDLDRLKDAVGPYGADLMAAMAKLRTVLHEGGSGEGVRSALATSSGYRKNLTASLETAIGQLDAIKASVSKGRFVDLEALN